MHNTWTALYKTWSKYESVWTSLMGSNRNSTVQLTTQIFGVRSDTWQPPSPWNSRRATGCERLVGKNPLSQGRTSVEMHLNVAQRCRSDLWSIYPLICFLVYLTSIPLDIGAHRALLVGRAHHKNIKAQFIWRLNKKHAVWLLCLGL